MREDSGTAMGAVAHAPVRPTVVAGTRPSRSSRARRLATLLLLVGGLVLALAPLPWLVFAPSTPQPVDAMIRIEGAPRELSGDLYVVPAGYRRATPALALWALVDPTRDLEPRPGVAAPRVVRTHDSSLQQSVMVAATVGLRLAGHQAPLTSDGRLELAPIASADPTRAVPDGATIAGRPVDANGGSAGLMLAVAVYDRFAATPILPRLSVTGTGTVDLAGRVGPVTGVRQKVIAAEEAGISIFLVPAQQLGEAVSASRGSLRFIPVTTVGQAIEALRSLR